MKGASTDLDKLSLHGASLRSQPFSPQEDELPQK